MSDWKRDIDADEATCKACGPPELDIDEDHLGIRLMASDSTPVTHDWYVAMEIRDAATGHHSRAVAERLVESWNALPEYIDRVRELEAELDRLRAELVARDRLADDDLSVDDVRGAVRQVSAWDRLTQFLGCTPDELRERIKAMGSEPSSRDKQMGKRKGA